MLSAVVMDEKAATPLQAGNIDVDTYKRFLAVVGVEFAIKAVNEQQLVLAPPHADPLGTFPPRGSQPALAACAPSSSTSNGSLARPAGRNPTSY